MSDLRKAWTGKELVGAEAGLVVPEGPLCGVHERLIITMVFVQIAIIPELVPPVSDCESQASCLSGCSVPCLASTDHPGPPAFYQHRLPPKVLLNFGFSCGIPSLGQLPASVRGSLSP